MMELTADCLGDVCGSPPVREQLGTLEDKRKAALRKFWLFLAIGIALGPLALFTLLSNGWDVMAWIVGMALLAVPLVLGYSALSGVAEDLKLPVLETIAERAGMKYSESGFSPPVYPMARKALFGGWLSSERFTDLFYGEDEEGRHYALYEACLQRKSGKNTHTVFSGQIYALQRRGVVRGITVVVPDRGLFNFFKPEGGMERVKLDGVEPEFEKRFEVYSSEPMEAKQLLLDAGFRARLLEYRRSGATYAWFGSQDVLVGVAGKNRFEPGSMFRSRPGEDRVRSMLDDVCASLAVLRELKMRLG